MKLSNKAALTKFLLCGIFASTIFLINCQPSTNRSVKARLGPNEKLTPTSKLAICSDKAIAAIKERNAVVSDIEKILIDSDKGELDTAQKVAIQKLIIDLKPKSDNLIAIIKTLRIGKDPADGCVQTDPNNPSKKIPHQILVIQSKDKDLAKKVSAVTKQSNTILDEAPPKTDGVDDGSVGDTQDGTGNADVGNSDGKNVSGQKPKKIKIINDGEILENKTLLVSKELGETLKEPKNESKVHFINGELFEGEAELNAALDQADKSVCWFSFQSGVLEAKSKITIKTIEVVKSEIDKGHYLTMNLMGKSDKMYALSCMLVSGKKVSEEFAKTFGDHLRLEIKPKN